MLNRSLDRPSAFSEATCNGLIGLLLRAAAVETAGRAPEWFIAELDSLAADDPSFSQWLQHNFATERDSLSWFCRQLVRQGRPSVESASYRSASRLQDCAFVLLRLAGLSASFADELEAWQQRQLYNVAYGLSHELNNPLANIVTRAGVLAQRTADPQSRQLLQTIIDSAHRGREMLGDLMTLARPPAIRCSPYPLATLVQEMTAKIRPWCEARNVTIELLESVGSPAEVAQACDVLIDLPAIREVLWGLIRNALEAMPNGGRLSLCYFVNAASKAVSAVADEPAVANWGVIEISDNGPGLSAIALKNCFDPFYSGREAGRGLGLGLSKAKALIQRQRGYIEVENLPTSGCRVTLWLPTA